MSSIIIYTDGACQHNPGPGGYGVVLTYGEHLRELQGGFRWTTNNRMEILAAIVGLEALKKTSQVQVVTDSQYVVNSMIKGWAEKWKRQNWMRTRSEKAKNADLWERLLSLSQMHSVTWTWVRGHSGHEMNERADRLAVEAREDVDALFEDKFFELEVPVE
jgi:ribonuclease HI